MLTALRYRNFRLLWIGLGISFAGSFMQQAAILWHVSLLVEPENKALALGMVGLVRVVPIIGFSLFSGVAADVFDRRKLTSARKATAGSTRRRPLAPCSAAWRWSRWRTV